ncbi:MULTISPECIES: SPOR domain-containing protein [unclassified Ensifer]|uniref:SPOR domain-containing protein n=1 Tax=unclassified Ensifer TaxID=2633371 RepID=UPI000813643F|nr:MULTISPECIES: SPOR domain-containing protein [unclassified Ensifer]OCP01132.1 D-alanyl-D-alanine carboxypeptidase [Ensifer sp. LC14]OCP05394.1 D-alanyl-D-alanine carboxypeptidase [Ensifer sp. LC11]OCP06006.1 D-alanyl-D-alanine carboxypeptidase [Ensifer sp. LC13]OCP30829.1 D-alanyl-D-alanine carboxypeptidase [Ensifer sp. LC499]
MRIKSSVVSQSGFFDLAKRPFGALSKMVGRVVLAGAIASAAFAAPAFAASKYANPKYSGIVVDAKTGKILYGEDADELRYPASLTKMMTLYLTFEALEAGRITTSTSIPFSKNASAEPPSKLGVRAGQSITVEQAILSLVTRSANDASTALGEFLGGSEQRFARMMTNKARALGMTRTTYRNANGLPNPEQRTTARDQARLGLALRQHFPQYYDYFSTRSFRFGKQTIGNHNRLLGNVRGVDGIKTGYTRASGFNLVTSAQIDGRSIVAVVMGGTSGASRDAQMRRLVAKYMPAASRRGDGNLIAETKPTPVPVEETQVAATAPVAETPVVAAAVSGHDLPNTGPVPDFRYNGESASSVQMAYAGNKRASDNPVLSPKIVPNTLDAQSLKLRQPVEAGMVDTQVTNSVPKKAEAVAKAEPAEVAKADPMPPQPQGWVIQIGATPDKDQAMTLLGNAKDKGGKALRNAKPFTVAFGQVYRARFGGFDDQNSAVNACKALKKKGISCWASQQ